MALPPHGDVTTAANLHRIGVIQSGDPGAIGAGKAWIDSDDGAVRVRNVADSGWLGPFSTAADISAAIAALVDTAPGALDTLNELAAALGDDASFAATVTTALGGKAALAGATFVGAVEVPDDPYDATGWNGNEEVPTKNAIRDKIESMGGGPGGSGAVVQVKNFQTGAVANGATLIPYDDTIPQNTEGDQYMSLAITPTSATNKLRIDVVVMVTPNLTNALVTVALFQDAVANALAAVGDIGAAGTAAQTISLSHYVTAGTTSATTFKVRVGVNAGSLTFNGSAAATRRYGGVAASSITITEIVP